MFSGIIEHTAKILSREGGVFRVENTFSTGLHEGQSIAHDGACMTLTQVTNTHYEFFVMEESLSVTSLRTRQVGDMLNIERCLKVGDRIDGHIVSGHVDSTGTVTRLEKKEDGSLIYGVEFDSRYNLLIVEKGSITINGVSLTLVEVDNGYFSVSLIPLTQEWTNLGQSKIGDIVNIEFDMLGKYVEKALKNHL